MVYLVCNSCKVQYHSQTLAVGDDYVPQYPECPKCGRYGIETDIICWPSDEMTVRARLAADRLGLLNILKAHVLALIEEIQRNGGMSMESFTRLETMKEIVTGSRFLDIGDTNATRPDQTP